MGDVIAEKTDKYCFAQEERTVYEIMHTLETTQFQTATLMALYTAIL